MNTFACWEPNELACQALLGTLSAQLIIKFTFIKQQFIFYSISFVKIRALKHQHVFENKTKYFHSQKQSEDARAISK